MLPRRTVASFVKPFRHSAVRLLGPPALSESSLSKSAGHSGTVGAFRLRECSACNVEPQACVNFFVVKCAML